MRFLVFRLGLTLKFDIFVDLISIKVSWETSFLSTIMNHYHHQLTSITKRTKIFFREHSHEFMALNTYSVTILANLSILSLVTLLITLALVPMCCGKSLFAWCRTRGDIIGHFLPTMKVLEHEIIRCISHYSSARQQTWEHTYSTQGQL